MAVGVIFARFEIDEHNRYAESLRAKTSQQLAKLASNLQSNIIGDVQLVQGVVAAIAQNPDIDQGSFENFCGHLFKERSELKTIGAAPNLIVRLIYPLEPNIKSLGLDYRTNAQQSDAAMQVRDFGRTNLIGPVKLGQGGTGLIVRHPVFAQDRNGAGQFWGIVSAVIDLDTLYVESGLTAPDLPIDIAVAKTSLGTSTAAFFGDGRLFSREPVLHTIDLGYDTWTIAAVPKGGWTVSPPGLAISGLGLLVIAAFIVGPLIWAGYLTKQRLSNILALQEREDKLETLSHRLQLALEASKIGVWEYDESTGDLLFDNRMRELFDIPSGKVSGGYEDWRDALHPDDIEAAERRFEVALHTDVKYETEFRIILRNGETRHIRGYGITYRSSVGNKRIVGANWDVTDDVLLQKELRDAHAHAEVQNTRLEEISRTLAYQSVHDALTGLPNRRYLDQYLEQPSQTPGHVFLHVDLDHFKEINDTLGHAAGDRVLQISASRLMAALGAGEFVARIGGDEFIIVATSDDPETRGRALGFSILDAFSRPLMDADFECEMGASIGVAAQGPGQTDLRQLIGNADIALYEAKKLGRNRVELFTETLRISSDTAKKTAEELLRGFENNEILPFFQPQFDATTLAVVGVEALVRWDHPERGLLAPDQFLSVAQGMNKVADIDGIILEKSLFQAARWAANDLIVPKLSVNISAQRLRDERLMQRLLKLTISPGSLSFELLESISFDGQDDALLKEIKQIKRLGIDIEIDDFGTGHASIVSLLEIAPKRLKIDRKLIAPITVSVPQQQLVSSIIEIGRSLGIEIIAEGVETMAHAEILRDLGCHTLQGYAFARPMASEDLMIFLKSWTQPITRGAPGAPAIGSTTA